MRDLYEILGVRREADQAEVRKAFKKLARRYHPDVSKEKDAESRFKEINAAYEVLSDEQRRAWYDEFGEEALRVGFDADRARAFRAAAGPRARGFGAGGFGDEGVSVDDLLGSLFGGGGSPFRGWQGTAGASRQGPDVEARTEIDLLTAIRGGETPLAVRRPESCAHCQGQGGTDRRACPACRGSGRTTESRFGMRAVVLCDECAGSGAVFAQECQACAGAGRVMASRNLRVHIPAGVEDGQVLRLRGLGGEGRGGGPAGNLLVSVGVLAHPLLTRRGRDLEMELPLTLAEALGGARIAIPTPSGELSVRVPPGAGNGQRLRLKGRGVPAPDGSKGDLYLVLRPVLPEEVTPEALELAGRLDALLGRDVRSGLRL